MKQWYQINRGDLIKCPHCNTDQIAFTAIRHRWKEFEHICEPCANKLPDFYYRYIDYGGTYSPMDGTQLEVEQNLKRILENEGKSGLRNVEVYLVPGKYIGHSDVDKRKFGKKLYLSFNLEGQVRIA